MKNLINNTTTQSKHQGFRLELRLVKIIDDLAITNGVSKSFIIRRLIEVGSSHIDEIKLKTI